MWKNVLVSLAVVLSGVADVMSSLRCCIFQAQ